MGARGSWLLLVSAAACTAPTASFSMPGEDLGAFIEPQAAPVLVNRSSSLQFAVFRSSFRRCTEHCLESPELDPIPATVVEAVCEPGCVITGIGTNAMRPAIGVLSIVGSRPGTSEVTLRLALEDGHQKITRRTLEFVAPRYVAIFSRAGDGLGMVAGATDEVQASAGDSETNYALVRVGEPGASLTVEGDALSVRTASPVWSLRAEKAGTATLVLDVGGTVARREVRVSDRADVVALELRRWDYSPLEMIGVSVRSPVSVRFAGTLRDGKSALLPPGTTCTIDPPDLARVVDTGVDHGVGIDGERSGTGTLRCAFGDLVATRPVTVSE